MRFLRHQCPRFKQHFPFYADWCRACARKRKKNKRKKVTSISLDIEVLCNPIWVAAKMEHIELATILEQIHIPLA